MSKGWALCHRAEGCSTKDPLFMCFFCLQTISRNRGKEKHSLSDNLHALFSVQETSVEQRASSKIAALSDPTNAQPLLQSPAPSQYTWLPNPIDHLALA